MQSAQNAFVEYLHMCSQIRSKFKRERPSDWNAGLHFWLLRYEDRARAIRHLPNHDREILLARNAQIYSMEIDPHVANTFENDLKAFGMLDQNQNRQTVELIRGPDPGIAPSYEWLLRYGQQERGIPSRLEAWEFVAGWSLREFGFYPVTLYRDCQKLDPKLSKFFKQEIWWQRTPGGNLNLPWQAEVENSVWQLELNDFPDHFLYTLRIDGKSIGHFNNWPQSWSRAAERPKPDLVYSGTWIERYRSGDCERVWKEMFEAGANSKAAQEVANETMRRAAHNIQSILARLNGIGFRFDVSIEPAGYFPSPASTREDLRHLKQLNGGGPLPLSLRAWWEIVGGVRLTGYHPTLCPIGAELAEILEIEGDEQEILADPLEVITLSEALAQVEGGLDAIELWGNEETKALWPDSGDGYAVQWPEAFVTDVLINTEPQETMFVEYLRRSFRWGGFPGWEHYEKRPQQILDLLVKDLMPI